MRASEPRPHPPVRPWRCCRYLLKAYWKARLAKIERFATAILDSEALRAKCRCVQAAWALTPCRTYPSATCPPAARMERGSAC